MDDPAPVRAFSAWMTALLTHVFDWADARGVYEARSRAEHAEHVGIEFASRCKYIRVEWFIEVAAGEVTFP